MTFFFLKKNGNEKKMWIELNKERVSARLSAEESDAVLGFDEHRHTGQDLLKEIIDAVAAEMRAAIAMCEKNRLDPRRGYIPMSLLNDALAMVSYHIGTRAGMPIEGTKDPRYNAWMRARESLDKLRTCAITVEDPESGEIASAGNNGSSVVVSTRTRMERGNWNF